MSLILVVDDRGTAREPLVAVLRAGGHTTLEAATGEQATALARTERPDLIIADLLMPTMDGYELVRELRRDPSTESTPVIFKTATHVLAEARALSDACGVAQIVVEPYSPEEVVRVVGEALSSPPSPPGPLPSEEFHRQHLRLISAKLLDTVEELTRSVSWRTVEGPSGSRSEPRQSPRPATPGDPALDPLLTERELEVLVALAEGTTNPGIADRLGIAEATVQSHVKHILRKLGAKNRTEAAVRYVRAAQAGGHAE